MTAKKPKRGRPSLGHTAELSVRMSPRLLKAARETAKASGVSVAEWVRRLVTFYSGFSGVKQ